MPVEPLRNAPTLYSGSVPCMGCGQAQPPTVALYGSECYACKKKRHQELKKNRMVGR